MSALSQETSPLSVVPILYALPAYEGIAVLRELLQKELDRTEGELINLSDMNLVYINMFDPMYMRTCPELAYQVRRQNQSLYDAFSAHKIMLKKQIDQLDGKNV